MQTAIIIRKEEPADFKAVFDLIERAFEGEELSDHQEQFLVERLRNSAAFVPELSLVAEADGQIIGYILLTKLKIISEDLQETESLALAPVAVLPAFQGKGIGSQLIRTAHEKARELGFQSVILLGHADYYPRFGYKRASTFGISLPFDVPDENCMALELNDDSLQGVNGMVKYPKEFGVA